MSAQICSWSLALYYEHFWRKQWNLGIEWLKVIHNNLPIYLWCSKKFSGMDLEAQVTLLKAFWINTA